MKSTTKVRKSNPQQQQQQQQAKRTKKSLPPPNINVCYISIDAVDVEAELADDFVGDVAELGGNVARFVASSLASAVAANDDVRLNRNFFVDASANDMIKRAIVNAKLSVYLQSIEAAETTATAATTTTLTAMATAPVTAAAAAATAAAASEILNSTQHKNEDNDEEDDHADGDDVYNNVQVAAVVAVAAEDDENASNRRRRRHNQNIAAINVSNQKSTGSSSSSSSSTSTFTIEYIFPSIESSQFRVHLYALNDDAAAEEMNDDELGTGGDDIGYVAFQHWQLPTRSLAGLWESLEFDGATKQDLLDYVATGVAFADANVDMNIIAWNRVVLLHGPPGTGKTSCCKALAQKISIRAAHRFPSTQLVEVNAHSLFSKWFSESGKLVMSMFAKIKDMAADNSCLVCVLIDEVESLTAARKSALAGTEPSDAIRVVNALLTQLDQLRALHNVLILTTSNITDAIDIAFVDRADVKLFIGPPSLRARYNILRSCVQELCRCALVRCADDDMLQQVANANDCCLCEFETAQLVHEDGVGRQEDGGKAESMMDLDENLRASAVLYDVAVASEGASGRTLRKLPFLAHAFGRRHQTSILSKTATTKTTSPKSSSSSTSFSLIDFMIALRVATKTNLERAKALGAM